MQFPAFGGGGGDPHALPAEDVLARLDTHGAQGLLPETAATRLAQQGPNALPEPRTRSALSVFIGQFRSPLIYLLFLAAAVALAFRHTGDALVIFVVVLLNAVIGAVQEGRAQRSLEALRRLVTRTARVVRGGEQRIVPAAELVPGDILLFEAGDAVAADARLLEHAALQVAEAALTGESVPVGKSLPPLAPGTPLADRHNMVYAGTHITAGRASAVVVATGPDTEIGRIAALAGAAAEPPTPLERRIARFGRFLILASAVVFVLVIGVGLLRGVPLASIVMVGISQVVSMIPEGLPVALTIALAVGVQRMARRRAVVRRLSAVETLGSTTVICSDKTGTLTCNEMTVTTMVLPDGRELAVTGVGYGPTGAFLEGGRDLDPAGEVGLRGLLEAGVLCNDARLVEEAESELRWQPVGDPTEVALLTVALKAGLVPGALLEQFPRRAEIPFSSAAKMMATQHDSPQGSFVLVKGAAEIVLAGCRAIRGDGDDAPLDDAGRRSLNGAAEQMAARALRVLAIGRIDGATIDGQAGLSAFQGRMTLLGLFGQLDPPRVEAQDAVARCRAAGIRPVMVTGDHKATGLAIARALDIAREGDEAIDGQELEAMSDEQLAARIARISVFARVHPAQKLRIVSAYQERGEVVAMTGDGVNDAPALARADVGVAMGLTGTEVAKESARIVIADDNFATIVAAVEEGRVVYRNIKKAILLLVSTSIAEVVVLLGAMFLGYPPPFVAVQILWNNLVTEGFITVNLIMEPPEGDEMRRKPIPRDEPLLTRVLLTRMAFMVPAIVLSTLGWFVYRLGAGIPEAQVRTETFTLLAICEWFNVLNCRSERKSALNFGVLRNRWLLGGLVAGNLLQIAVVYWAPLGRVFHTVPFSVREVVALGVVGSLVFWVEEARKFVVRRQNGSGRLAAAG